MMNQTRYQVRSCSHYDFLRVATSFGGGLQAPPIDVLLAAMFESKIECNHNLGTPYSGRIPFNIEALSNVLDLLEGHSIILDIPLCHSASSHKKIREEENTQGIVSYVELSLFDRLAADIAKLKPRKKGVLVVVSGTSEYRTADSQFIQDRAGNTWSLVNDDTFVTAGFVPGEKSAILSMLLYTPLAKLRDFTNLMDFKTSLNVICDPHSYHPSWVGWNSYALMGRMIVQIQRLAEHVGYMTLFFGDEEKMMVLGVDVKDGQVVAVCSQTTHHAFITHIAQAITWQKKNIDISIRPDMKHTCLRSLKTLFLRHGINAYLLWRMLLAWKTAQESFKDEAQVASTIRHSRIINEYLDEDFSDELIEDMKTLCVESKDFLAFMDDNTVTIGSHEIHKGLIDAVHDSAHVTVDSAKAVSGNESLETPIHNHERPGLLNLPRLPRRKRIRGLTVLGGRGQAVSYARASVGFSVGEKRFVLRVDRGKVLSKNCFSEQTALKRFYHLRKIGSHWSEDVEYVESSEHEDVSSEKGISDLTANKIINGCYGTMAAMWLWAQVLCGKVVVSESSLDMTYVSMGNRKWAKEGIHFWANLDAGCFSRVITYCSDKENGGDDGIWVDIYDDGELREVKKVVGALVEIGKVDKGAVSKVKYECSLGMNVFVR